MGYPALCPGVPETKKKIKKKKKKRFRSVEYLCFSGFLDYRDEWTESWHDQSVLRNGWFRAPHHGGRDLCFPEDCGTTS